jgi:hypothetical protein
MELGERQVDRLHVLIGHLDAHGIEVAVDLALDCKACFGLRGADELDNHLVTDVGRVGNAERLAAITIYLIFPSWDVRWRAGLLCCVTA